MLFEDVRLEAYEINEYGQRIEGSKNVTIKDYWLDSSREAEPITLKKILEGAYCILYCIHFDGADWW